MKTLMLAAQYKMALHTTIVATMIPKNWKVEENEKVYSTRNLNKTEKVALKTGHSSVVVIAVSHLGHSMVQQNKTLSIVLLLHLHSPLQRHIVTLSCYCTYVSHHS